MSRPPLFPQQAASGIAVNPRTLERVIPESKRADGSVRKEIKIRPGFTPQEDVSRFRGTRQQAMDTAALPKGHILGWVAPSSESQQKAKGAGAPPPNKNAKRRAQKAKKAAEKAEAVRDSWEDEEDTTAAPTADSAVPSGTQDSTSSADQACASEPSQDEVELTVKISKLEVK